MSSDHTPIRSPSASSVVSTDVSTGSLGSDETEEREYGGVDSYLRKKKLKLISSEYSASSDKPSPDRVVSLLNYGKQNGGALSTVKKSAKGSIPTVDRETKLNTEKNHASEALRSPNSVLPTVAMIAGESDFFRPPRVRDVDMTYTYDNSSKINSNPFAETESNTRSRDELFGATQQLTTPARVQRPPTNLVHTETPCESPRKEPDLLPIPPVRPRPPAQLQEYFEEPVVNLSSQDSLALTEEIESESRVPSARLSAHYELFETEVNQRYSILVLESDERIAKLLFHQQGQMVKWSADGCRFQYHLHTVFTEYQDVAEELMLQSFEMKSDMLSTFRMEVTAARERQQALKICTLEQDHRLLQLKMRELQTSYEQLSDYSQRDQSQARGVAVHTLNRTSEKRLYTFHEDAFFSVRSDLQEIFMALRFECLDNVNSYFIRNDRSAFELDQAMSDDKDTSGIIKELRQQLLSVCEHAQLSRVEQAAMLHRVEERAESEILQLKHDYNALLLTNQRLDAKSRDRVGRQSSHDVNSKLTDATSKSFEDPSSIFSSSTDYRKMISADRRYYEKKEKTKQHVWK